MERPSSREYSNFKLQASGGNSRFKQDGEIKLGTQAGGQGRKWKLGLGSRRGAEGAERAAMRESGSAGAGNETPPRKPQARTPAPPRPTRVIQGWQRARANLEHFHKCSKMGNFKGNFRNSSPRFLRDEGALGSGFGTRRRSRSAGPDSKGNWMKLDNFGEFFKLVIWRGAIKFSGR